ncbi:hypothetical protein [Nocardia otitidiscaviarum]|uniref:hypothetical protein n=1 Tax=Nocardia otitidiscaviarum TaxID=1823 RepID=UPI0004A719E3|nr:hypothetical protein [Nocardia otitidiscaviarum]
MAEITNCTCDLTTGCGEYDEAGCPACRESDVYLPCPVFGFVCFPFPDMGPCDCCTPEQQEMTRQFHDKGMPNA